MLFIAALCSNLQASHMIRIHIEASARAKQTDDLQAFEIISASVQRPEGLERLLGPPTEVEALHSSSQPQFQDDTISRVTGACPRSSNISKRSTLAGRRTEGYP